MRSCPYKPHTRRTRPGAALAIAALATLVCAPHAFAQPAQAGAAATSKAQDAEAARRDREAARQAEEARRQAKADEAAKARKQKKARADAAALLKKIAVAKPGPERYALVDALIELGEDAWPVIEPALEKAAKLPEGEAVVVDLTLGMMPMSYDRLVTLAPQMSDAAARRVLRFVLRSAPGDKRQDQLLESMLSRNDERLLLEVIPALHERQHPAVMKRLVELVDDPRPKLQAYAIDLLAAGKQTEALPVLVRLFGIEQRRATDKNHLTRIKLINAIARIGGEPAVDPLLEAMNLPDQRAAVLDGLRLVGAPAVRAALFLLQSSTGPRIQVALQLLSHMRQQAAPELVKLLAHGDRGTRELAMDVLAHIQVPDVRDLVVQMVRERRFVDPEVGVRLAITLYDETVRKLLFDLLEAKDPELRAFVVEQLWRLRDPKTFAALRWVAAKDPNRMVQLKALQAVGGVNDPKALPLLRKMVGVTDEETRVAVLDVLGRIDTWQNAVPAISGLLGDPNEVVFRAALGTLRRMSFRSGHHRQAQWMAWYRSEMERAKEAHETLVPAERRFAVGTREMSYLEAGEDRPTIVCVSGPPFRDATHLAPHVFRLASDYRVAVLKRAPGPYRAARSSEAERTAELQAMLGRLGERPVVLLADASGAHFALNYAAQHPRDVSRVILHGAFWPDASAIEAVVGQVDAAVRNEMRPDVEWGLRAQWRVPANVAQRTVLRGVLSGVLADWDSGRRVALDNVAVDGFSRETLDRERESFRAAPVGAVKKPVLLLVGAKAPWYGSTVKAHKKLPKATRKQVRLITVPNAGWMPLLENPSMAVDAIDDFLS